MKLNARLRIKISSELLDQLKKEAINQEVTITELCRQKLKNDPPIIKLEQNIDRLVKILDKYGQHVTS